MKFDPPLQPATLIRRYKRFLADIRFDDGTEVTAHVANPGAMTGLADEGLRIWVQPSTNPKRKLKWSWYVAEIGPHFAGIDTSVPNRIVGEALAAREIPELSLYDQVQPEQKYGINSRIDFLLTGEQRTYVEVKNVHLVRTGSLAEFPDCVTKRGAKHLDELSAMVAEGNRAVMLFVIQHTGCDHFTLARDIDPAYGDAFDRARAAGVEFLVRSTEITPDGIRLIGQTPIPFSP